MFHTPSHGACFRSAHKAAGRVALPCSLLGAGFGFLTVWWERYAVLEAGQRIGLSVVGALQLYSSVVGWRAIRAVRGEDHEEERAAKIRTHALHMINVFMCCFGASMLRVAPKVLGALGVSMDNTTILYVAESGDKLKNNAWRVLVDDAFHQFSSSLR